jgi:anti-anti-sigma regulatory factor
MFKISIVDTPAQRTLVVEGKLSEPWVDELRTTWENMSRDLEGRKLVIDLNSLTVISREGEDAIFDLMKRGAKFSCAGILTRHVLKRVAQRCRCEPRYSKETQTMKT